jgi:endonuclease/exonuclease/phosphatase family metal-dependent hydrolase
MTLRVLSYNIHKGFSSNNRRFVLDDMRNAIRSVGADIVFLQEVLGEHSEQSKLLPEALGNSQFEYLADSIWPHQAYGKNRIYALGHQGNAILSKFPIISSSNYDISTNRFERRGLLHVAVDWPGLLDPLHCICVHLGLTGRGRKVQLERLSERIQSEVPQDNPLIVAGDFNDWALSASRVLSSRVGVHEVFHKARGRHAGTFPAKAPLLRLDRIYCRGFEGVDATVLHRDPWSSLSDHAALSVDLRPLASEISRQA